MKTASKLKQHIFAVGFGVEKIGYLGLKAPFLSLAFLICITFIGFYGSTIMVIDDRISTFFESDRKRFAEYNDYLDNFPTDENDVLIIFEAKDQFTPEVLTALRWFQIDLRFRDDINSALSLFSLRKPSEQGGTVPIIPDPVPQSQKALSDLLNELNARDASSNIFIGNDQKSLLFVVNLNKENAAKTSQGVNGVLEFAQDFATAQNLNFHASGAPVIRKDVSKTVGQDRIRFNVIGFLLGLGISILVFKHVRLVIISAIPALISAIWTLGYLGISGQPMNMITTVIPAFVMVIAYADSVHMLYAIRKRLAEGKSGAQAAYESIGIIGPACVLTSLTTAIAVLSLTLNSSQLIVSFGWAACIGAVFALFSVLLAVPVLTAILFKAEKVIPIKPSFLERQLNGLSQMILKLVTHNAGKITLFALFLTIASLLSFALLESNYRIRTHVPDHSLSKEGLDYLTDNYGGLNEMVILLKGKPSLSNDPDDFVTLTGEIISSLKSDKHMATASSLLSLATPQENISPAQLVERLHALPSHIKEKLVNEDENQIAITARFKIPENSSIHNYANDIENQLNEVIKPYQDFEIIITGTSILTSESTPMLKELRNSLIGAFFTAIIVIGLAFRSFKIVVLSIMPNILPLSIAGLFLYLTDWQFEFASAMALTVAFGIAVDDTIHMLHRFQLSRNQNKDVVRSIRQSAKVTILRVGPVILLATLILVAGMSVAITSEMPTMRIFGVVAIIVLVSALITDIIFLPAAMIALSKFNFYKREDKDDGGNRKIL